MAKKKSPPAKAKAKKKAVSVKAKPKKKATSVKTKPKKKAQPTEAKPRKADTRGCGRWVGSCGGHHAGSVSISGTCACGRHYSKSCSQSNCPGVSFYC